MMLINVLMPEIGKWRQDVVITLDQWKYHTRQSEDIHTILASFSIVDMMYSAISILRLSKTTIRQWVPRVIRIRTKVHSIWGMGQGQLKEQMRCLFKKYTTNQIHNTITKEKLFQKDNFRINFLSYLNKHSVFELVFYSIFKCVEALMESKMAY